MMILVKISVSYLDLKLLFTNTANFLIEVNYFVMGIHKDLNSS